MNKFLFIAILGLIIYGGYSTGRFDTIFGRSSNTTQTTGTTPEYCNQLVELRCDQIRGEYLCNDNGIGCYNPQYFDAALCSSGQIDYVKNLCPTGWIWTCTANEVSCKLR